MRSLVISRVVESFSPENAPWLADLEDELASFPGGMFDDQVDCIVQALNRLRGGGDDLTVINLYKEHRVRSREAIPAETEANQPCGQCTQGYSVFEVRQRENRSVRLGRYREDPLFSVWRL